MDWFPPPDLPTFRTLFAASAATIVLAHLPWFIRTIRIHRAGLDAVSTPLDDDMENIAIEELPQRRQFPASAMPTLPLALVAITGLAFATTLLAAAADWRPRTMLLAATPLYLLFFSQALQTSKVVRKTSLLPWTCLLLALAPEDGDGQALTILAIKIVLAHMWFAAGLCKLRYGGWRWCDGSTLRHHLAVEALQNRAEPERSAGMRLAMHPGACAALACLTVVSELASPLVVLPTVAWACLLAWAVFLCLHLGIWITWGLDYLSFCFLPIGLVLLVPTEPSAIAASFEGPIDWRGAATIGIAGFFILNSFIGHERWPVHGWPMFSGRVPWGHVRVKRLHAWHDGRRSPVVLRDRYMNRGIARHGRYLLWYGEQWTRDNGVDPATITRLELVETTIDETDRIEHETITTFARLTQLRRWLWRPPWEEIDPAGRGREEGE